MPDARTPLVAGLVAVVVTAGAVLAGVVAGLSGSDPQKPPPPTPTVQKAPLESFDTSGLVVARAAFCAGIGSDPVTDALGGAVESSSSYGNGQAAQLTSKVKDVAHEFDCTWHGADGTTARTWVFAPPVTRKRATDLVALTEQARGCSRLTDAAAYGNPSTGVECRSSVTQVSYRGLFGDAWLSCSITAPSATDRDELVARAGRWCVAVAKAASAPADATG